MHTHNLPLPTGYKLGDLRACPDCGLLLTIAKVTSGKTTATKWVETGLNVRVKG